MTTKTFPAYTFTVRPVVVYDHIFDDKSKQIKPIKTMDGIDVHEVLDSMALAMEAGEVNTHSWPQQFFASRKAFDEFIEQLECYDECYRITDEWWTALATLAGSQDCEEGFITTAEMAQEIVNEAEEDGLLGNWGKKTPVYKYSEKQCEEALYQMVVYYERLNNNRTSVTDAQRAEQSRHSEITSFGSKYYGTARRCRLNAKPRQLPKLHLQRLQRRSRLRRRWPQRDFNTQPRKNDDKEKNPCRET